MSRQNIMNRELWGSIMTGEAYFGCLEEAKR
jgi:hypothetical protein